MPFEVGEKIFEWNRALLQVRFYRRWFSESVALFACEIVGRTWSPRAKYSIGRVRNSRVLSDMDQPGPGRDSLACTWHEPCTEMVVCRNMARETSDSEFMRASSRAGSENNNFHVSRVAATASSASHVPRYTPISTTDGYRTIPTKRRYLPTNLRCTRRVVISWKFYDREICPICRYATAT